MENPCHRLPSMKIFITLLLYAVHHIQAMVEVISLPENLQSCFDHYHRSTNLKRSVGAQIHWSCMQEVLSQSVQQLGLNVTIEEQKWIEDIMQMPKVLSPHGGRKKRQAITPRIRKEYRVMTNEERERYHKAVDLLKKEKVGHVSKYDFLASIHRGNAIPMSHRGANFLGWHRIYLLIYENALRKLVPGVTVPYFATVFDDEMDDPTKSVIWSEMFLGNGDGVVKTGPYANWNTPSGPMVRNIGMFGQLSSHEGIAKILNKTRMSEITYPSAADDSNLELIHDGVHQWIGGGNGQMNNLNTAAQDPSFFNLHCFVDYIWEEFRSKQLLLGINPQVDFPHNYGPATHAPDSIMGLSNLRNIDGISNIVASMYLYEQLPQCSHLLPFCGSVYLYCNTKLNPPRCVSRTTQEVKETLSRNQVMSGLGNQMHSTPPVEGTCDSAIYRRAIQNRFQLGDKNDLREWVYLPVEIIYKRAPEYSVYNSFPLFQGSVRTETDIYSPGSYEVTDNLFHTDRLAKFRRCEDSHLNAGRVFVKSNGLNYDGTYTEFAVVDNRLALSKTVAYVAVKTPESGITEALLAAHDSCGRICRAYCRVTNNGAVSYMPCNGAIRLDSKSPKFYSKNYGESLMNIWKIPTDGICPSLSGSTIFVKFYCDYMGKWPWAKQQFPQQQYRQQQQQQRRNSYSAHPSRLHVPADNMKLKDINSEVVDRGSRTIPGCLLGDGCIIKRKCGYCQEGEKHMCLKSYNMFADCHKGRLTVRRCLGRSTYDRDRQACSILFRGKTPLI